MAILPVQPQPSQTTQPKSRIEAGNALRKAEKEPSPAETLATTLDTADRVNFQGNISFQTSSAIVADRTLERVELETTAAQRPDEARQALEAAGKSEFEATVFPQATEENVAEVTADRITEGVTGHIFQAFQANNTELTEENLLEFRDQVNEGLEAGLADARDILTGLQALNSDVESDIARTEALVRDQLDTFIEDKIQSLRETAAEESSEASEAVELLNV